MHARVQSWMFQYICSDYRCELLQVNCVCIISVLNTPPPSRSLSSSLTWLFNVPWRWALVVSSELLWSTSGGLLFIKCSTCGRFQTLGLSLFSTVASLGLGWSLWWSLFTWTTLDVVPLEIFITSGPFTAVIIYLPSQQGSNLRAVGIDNHTRSPTAKCRVDESLL